MQLGEELLGRVYWDVMTANTFQVNIGMDRC